MRGGRVCLQVYHNLSVSPTPQKIASVRSQSSPIAIACSSICRKGQFILFSADRVWVHVVADDVLDVLDEFGNRWSDLDHDDRWRRLGRGRDARCPRVARSLESPRLDHPTIRNDRFTSIRDVRLRGTSVARRVDLTRSKLLSGTVAPGALAPSSLRRLRPRFRPSSRRRNQRCPRDLLN